MLADLTAVNDAVRQVAVSWLHSGHDMSLFHAPTVLGSGGPGFEQGACLALVEQLETVYTTAHSTMTTTPSRRRDAHAEFTLTLHQKLGQAPEQIVPACWNSTAPFAANMSTKHTCLTAPGQQRALFADGSRCETRRPQRGPHHWHTLASIRPCRCRTVCFVPAPVQQSKIILTQWLRSGTCQRASTYE